MQSSNPAARHTAVARDGVVVVIGTGGTIAGSAARADDHIGYSAGTLDPAQLVAAVPALAGLSIATEQLAQLDSKDMDHATWQALAVACQRQLARPDVAGIVVTHGTDTLEETAFFLHRTVAAHKPVVLTAAMRPATALSADGPQNLLDAVTLARHAGARGVMVVVAGRVHAGADLRKLHGYRMDTFSSGDAGLLGLVENGRVRALRCWPSAPLHPARVDAVPAADWPVVDIVTSHAGVRAATLDALVAAGATGIVIAGTGNGTVHHALEVAAWAAVAHGVVVWRASRCVLGGVVGGLTGNLMSNTNTNTYADAHTRDRPVAPADDVNQTDDNQHGEPLDPEADVENNNAGAGQLPSAGDLTPVQARIELMLDLMPQG